MGDNTERFDRSWMFKKKTTVKHSAYCNNELDDFINAGQTLSLEDNAEDELDFNDED